jgi:hypothetical protein
MFGNNIPIRASSSESNKKKKPLIMPQQFGGSGRRRVVVGGGETRDVSLPGIRPNRAGAQSAPPLISPQKNGNDSLRVAWNNARKKRDNIVIKRKVGMSKESGDQPKWNSFHSMKNTYESNAVSIRNRMLRGVNPKKRE